MKQTAVFLSAVLLLALLLSACGAPDTAAKGQTKSTKGGLTLEEVMACQNGTAMGNGFYIKKGKLFYPCAMGGFVGGWGATREIVTTGNNVPQLDKSAGDQLVCFSSSVIPSLPFAAAEFHGKTIPVCIEERWYESSDITKLMLVPNDNLYAMNWDKINAYIQNSRDREEIEAFFCDLENDSNKLRLDTDGCTTIDDFTWGGIWSDCVDEDEYWEVGYFDFFLDDEVISTYILSCVENAEVPIEYYIGSQYKQVTLPAIIDFWYVYNIFNAPVSITKDGYYIVDTESMEPGTYTIYDSTLTELSDYPYHEIDEHHGFYDDEVYEECLHYDSATIFSVQ